MSQAKRDYYAERLQNAIKYLNGTPIDKKSLVLAVGIIRTARKGALRGYLIPTEVTALSKYRQPKSTRKVTAVGK